MSEPDPLDTILDQLDPSALRDERRRHLEAIADRQRRIDAIDHLLALKGDASPQANNGQDRTLTPSEVDDLMRPSLATSILAVMETGEEWNADLLLAHLELRNQAPRGKTPKNSVAATLSRLTSEEKVKRIRPGLYTLVRNGQDATPAATGGTQQQRLVEEAG
jgi:hypothetical protein